MNRPTLTVQAASRDQEAARAAFKRRIGDITDQLATWPALRLRGTPPDADDVNDQQNIVLHADLDGRPVVVKVYVDTAADCAAAEAAALDRYATFGLPVPRVIDLRSTQLTETTSCTLLVLSQLPGSPLSLHLPNRDPTVAADAGEQVGRLLAAQHHAERFPLTSPDFLHASWRRIRSRYEQTLVQELHVNPHDLDTMDHCAQSLPDPASLGWVTFDWRLRHLLWNGTTITGLVDLEYAKPYDSAVELANLLHDLTLHLDPARRTAFAQAARAAYEERVRPDERPSDERLLFCMARQAFSHAAVKHWQGVHDRRITNELRLATHYLNATSIDGVLRRPPSTEHTTSGPAMTAATATDIADRLRAARLLALDFDGVLTDGRLYIHESGDATKTVSYLDIVGITRWRRSGRGLCIISGDGASGIPAHYATAFKVPELYTGRMDKLDALREAADHHGISLDHAIYMGDDVMDLPAMAAAAVGATVPTAHPHVRQHADWISTQPAGAGAVRELIDLTLTLQGNAITDLRPSPPPTRA